MLPDVSELLPSERCDTGLVARNGERIEVFSSQNPTTVDRHFAWMEQYGIQSIALQRFAVSLLHDDSRRSLDNVLFNVRNAAEKHGRTFFVMYDLTDMPIDKLAVVAADWARLKSLGVAQSESYQRHRGHPLLGIWGLGYADRPLTPPSVDGLLDALDVGSAGNKGVTILGGVAADWRTGTGGASSDPAWKSVWHRLGVISPWSVGRFADIPGADRYKRDSLIPDMVRAKEIGVDYMPVLFPGFAWANLQRARNPGSDARYNQIPRQCGHFYWRQIFNAVTSGATMLYGAMFDEVDEGTAFFKVVPTGKNAPEALSFLTLDADSCSLESDWYLRFDLAPRA